MDLQVCEIRSFIPASDFELSKAFYEALGFSIDYSDANLALLSAGGQHLYLQRYYVKDWADNSMLHISVADAQGCFEQISALLFEGRFPTARVAAPKQEPYGALVTYVWDPAGVLLHLAQWLD
jgi:hypothetical protein